MDIFFVDPHPALPPQGEGWGESRLAYRFSHRRAEGAMYKNILIPLDRSKLAEEVLETAIGLAKTCQARISLIYVFELIPILPKDRESEYRVLKEEGERYLAEIKQRIEPYGIATETILETGDPSLVICKYAERDDIDLIIMSSHGRGGFERWALGSVSDKVLRHSPKPVLLIRSAAREVLRDRKILVVDDEPDVLESVAEVLDMCTLTTATDHDTALGHIKNSRFDMAILDIMGVDGFDLLRHTVSKGIPTVMLTAHALTPEALQKSARLGAISFLPKEKIPELENFLVEVIRSGGKPVWEKIFDKLAPLFRKRFGWTSAEEEVILGELEKMAK
jgi:nucleotide-binding universal stress UspA family protein/DNA-binding NarL/FixJ family response regulator